MAELLSQMNFRHVISRFFTSPPRSSAPGGQAAGQQQLARRRLSHLPEHLLRDIGL